MNIMQNKISGSPLKGWISDTGSILMRLRIVLCMVILIPAIGSNNLFSQGVGISEIAITPESSSILELRSTVRGFLAPRMTTAQRIALGSTTPAAGLLVYDTETKSFWYWDAGWKAFASGAWGTSNQLLGMNDAGDANEYKTLLGTTNQINVAHSAGQITLSTPQDIHTGASPVFHGLTVSDLSPNAGVYTDGSRALTSTPPLSGVIGYWSRTGNVLSPVTVGDHVTTSGNIYTTGTGTITSAGLLTGNSGAVISGGIINLNNDSNFPVNINTGNSTGPVTIGNSNNTITLPAFSTAGVVHNSATGLLSTGLIVNDDIANATINLTTKVTGILPIANGGTNSGAPLQNHRVMVSRGGQIVEAGHLANGMIIVGKDDDEPQLVPMNGDITINNTGVTAIGSGRVLTNMLSDGAVTSGKISDGSIVNIDINADAAIDVTKIAGGEVDNTEFEYLNGVTSGIQPQFTNIQTELDATQTGAGLNGDGTYTANASGNYIKGATSLVTADNLLDAQVKINADNIANSVTDVTALQEEVDNIETGSGLNADGTYTSSVSANYISTATSLNVADNLLDAQLKTTTDNLGSEVIRATAAEGVLTTNLAAEVTRATGAEATLTTNLNSEVARATAAEGVLTTNLAAEVTRATAAENTLTTNLATEVTNRTNGDAALQTELDATQTGAGLNGDGTYTANAAGNYIKGATSLVTADNLLDAQVKINADNNLLKANISGQIFTGEISATNLSGTNSGDVTLAGQNYLSLTGQEITANAINLSGANVTGTLAAERFPALTGDVITTAGSLATTIASNAVGTAEIQDNAILYNKIQNLSTTSGLLGSSSTTTAVQEIILGSGLSLTGTTLTSTGTGGTVTSVGLSLPSFIEVTNSTVTGSGVLTGTLADQSGNTVFSSPADGSTGVPVFRSLVSADIPNLNWSKITTGKPTTLAGYGITDAMSTSHAANGITSTNITNWNTAYGWGNHATAGYLTSFTETDPVVKAINGIVKSNGTTISAAIAGTDYVVPNGSITAGTNTKITYDLKGLVTGSSAAVLASADYAGQGSATAVLHGGGAGNPSWSQIINSDISATADISDSKLATISAAGKVANSATTATDANTANTIVLRDVSGNFAAGTITANLSGNASSATNATNAVNATSAGTATNLAGGLGGSIPYQSSANTTVMLANGTAGQVLTSNGGTTAPSWTTLTGWGITGNSGTNPSTDFVGTRDDNDLVFRVNNIERARIVSATGDIKIGDANSGTLISTKELIMRQDGDTYGSSVLRLRNRNDENGAIFETTHPTTTLIDFIFKTASNQRNIRYESRPTMARTGNPSFHIGGTDGTGADPDNPVLSIGDYYSAFSKPLRIGNYSSPTALLHLAAGTSAAGTAPLKFTTGTNLSSPEDGAVEYDGNLYVTSSGTRYTLARTLTNTQTLNFDATAGRTSRDLTITINGASSGDVVLLGVPAESVNPDSNYTAWVSSANTVTVRFNNYSTNSIDPVSGTFRVSILKY